MEVGPAAVDFEHHEWVKHLCRGRRELTCFLVFWFVVSWFCCVFILFMSGCFFPVWFCLVFNVFGLRAGFGWLGKNDLFWVLHFVTLAAHCWIALKLGSQLVVF